MILLSPECTLWKNYGNEAGSVLGKSVKSNKTLYRPCTAVSYTLTHDNLIEVANIITTSGVLHHCSLNLGVFTSVQVTMLYLEENLRQQTLASIFETSQATISRAINSILSVLDVVLPSSPQPEGLNPNRLYVLDGTLIPCWWWKDTKNLYSGKHYKARHNLQILTDQAGEIFYISEAQPGSFHDMRAIKNTGLFNWITPWHCTADKGYTGSGCDAPFKRRPRNPC